MTIPASLAKGCVAYLVVPSYKDATQARFAHSALMVQEERIQTWINTQPNENALLERFIETIDKSQRHRHSWPELKNAIRYCLANQSHLLIGEIRNLISCDSFTQQILTLIEDKTWESEFICCDQPLMTKDNFAAIIEHAKLQKVHHGQLIKAGLSRTNAKSGNPHAAEIISKINRTKIDNAVVFALMLQPVIADYRLRGLSQRKMVMALNDEGYKAPEGGLWVLSQLQKVLNRIKLNEAALHLNNNVECTEKVNERIKQLDSIIELNELILELIPTLEKFQVDELTEDVFAQEIQMQPIKPLSQYLTNHPEESLKEIYKRILLSLEYTLSLEKVFRKNPRYTQYLRLAEQHGTFSELQISLLKLLDEITPAAKKFLIPSYLKSELKEIQKFR